MENKIVVIPDVHGRDYWEKILEKEGDNCKVVFLGDYFDSKERHTPEQQINNFKEIIEFKQNNMERVILLTGNHDHHYFTNTSDRYSGFQHHSYPQINKLIEKAKEDYLIQMCYVLNDKYVFSHAGITNTWAKNNDITDENFSKEINELFYHNINKFDFTIGYNLDPSGNDITQSPIWVRIPSLLKDMFGGDKYTFVIGHTPLLELTITNNLIGTDTMGTSKEYLVIENDKPIIKKL